MRFLRGRGGSEKAPVHPAEEQSWSWQTAHVSTVGASHLRNTIECQDDSDSLSFDAGRWAYVIVADGHGSDRHFRSARGSEFAVRALAEVFTAFPPFLRELNPPATVATARTWWSSEAARLVVSNWRARVHADLVRDPPRIPPGNGGEPGVKRFFDHMLARKGFSHLATELFPQFQAFEAYAAELETEPLENLPPLPPSSDAQWDAARLGAWQAKAYGTTLLGILIGPDALYWLQLGDGALVKIVGGQADYLTPPPDEAIANETPSLCDDDAVRKIRLGTMPRVGGGYFPSALILATDGVSNSYEDTPGFFKFCQDVAERAVASPNIVPQLGEWLPEISRKGSGDDMSVALVWATEVATKPDDRVTVSRPTEPEEPEAATVPSEPPEEPDPPGESGASRVRSTLDPQPADDPDPAPAADEPGETPQPQDTNGTDAGRPQSPDDHHFEQEPDHAGDGREAQR